MVPILSLWLPIILSAVFVFILSSVIHMALNYHANDFLKVPDETAAMDAVRKLNLPEGSYAVPKAGSMKEMSSPGFQEKMKKGPNVMMSVWGGTDASMTKPLVLWFLYSIAVGIFAAYIAGRALAPGAHYLAVFRFVGATAFACYGFADIQRSIWWRQPWSNTAKNLFDALLYASFTAGTFGWLWPQM